jgi:hypothetical protein
MNVFVKPKNGAEVRDPATFAVVPPEGRNIEVSSYWLRKIMQGYLVVIEDQPAKIEETNDGDLV